MSDRHLREQCVRDMLRFIGENPQREGLLETPARVVKAWQEWFTGYAQDPGALFKSFEDGAENYNEMVVLDSIPVQSHCEHHMAPFVGTAVVAYIPDGRIIGLSKITRLVDVFAKRLQVQERLTNQIADAMMTGLVPRGVAVLIRAEHFCMATRGVHKPGVFTTTSTLRGIFMDATVRSEFLSLARSRQ
jgi:GTP cyclohydrolase IA